jgi:hypothetical protein
MVAVVGGDGARQVPLVAGAVICQFPSVREGGNGRQQHAIAAIRGGAFALVLVVVRWMGHSHCDNVRRACRRSGVPCLVVVGGMASVARVVEAFVAREGRHGR